MLAGWEEDKDMHHEPPKQYSNWGQFPVGIVGIVEEGLDLLEGMQCLAHLERAHFGNSHQRKSRATTQLDSIVWTTRNLMS